MAFENQTNGARLTEAEFKQLNVLPWKTIKEGALFKQAHELDQLALYLRKHPTKPRKRRK